MRGRFVARWIEAVAEQIDDHARYRHVHPDRPGPARNLAMAREVAAQRPPQRNQRQRHDRRGENDVRNQDAEIDRTDRAPPLKAHVADVIVIGRVGDEEQGRDREGAQHAGAMRPNPAHPDKYETGQQQDRGDAVQDRIERGEGIVRKRHRE